ncbi:MAG TPA: hypothetical protein VL463_28130 [Kofleriaceae bacterium]|nr:hypothetical protein [Kofleriaceae bacterium]
MRGVGIALVVGLLAGAGPVEVANDGVPPGMVSFFATPACPAGWVPAEVASGRLVIAVNDPIAVGHTVGDALAPAEDRTHAHAIGGAISLPGKSISAADGNNDSGGASGSRTIAGTAGAAPSGLPFVQLTACVRSLQ